MDEFPVMHWDEVPRPGTGFAVAQFKDGEHKGLWGIKASLPDNRWAWIAYGDPAKPEKVIARDRVEAQRVLTEFRKYEKMKQKAEQQGDWEKSHPSGLPDPRTLPVVSWEQVPESAPLQTRHFLGDIWGIVAQLPDGEHLVILDRFAQDAGFHNFSSTQAEAQRVIDWLQLTDVSAPAKDPGYTPPFGPESVPAAELGVDPEKLQRFLEEIEYVEMGWLGRLHLGKRETCVCPSCRADYVRWLDRIAEYFQEFYGGVPTEIWAAIRFTLKIWEAREKQDRKPPVNWYSI